MPQQTPPDDGPPARRPAGAPGPQASDLARDLARDLGWDLACLGEPMLELNLIRGDPGAPRAFLEGHGGDASNVAVAAARQGARVAMVSAVGDDAAGASLRALWAREGVDASAVRTDPERPTGLYFVEHDAGGHHFSYLRRGSAASHHRLDEAGAGAIGRARILFASGIGLAISDRSADAVFEAAESVRRAGGLFAFDTNYRPKLWPKARAAALIERAVGLADVAFPGLDDMAALLGLSDPDRIVDRCLGLGARLVVLKMGAAGALLATPDARVAVPPFPCVPLDATGAGDAFCGAFLARHAAGATAPEAARYAACAAALATTGYGAVPPIPRRDAVLAALAATAPADGT